MLHKIPEPQFIFIKWINWYPYRLTYADDMECFNIQWIIHGLTKDLKWDVTLILLIQVSGQKKLFFVGHSQGAEMGFIGFSQNKELADKIFLFGAFAPIARITYAKVGNLLLYRQFQVCRL